MYPVPGGIAGPPSPRGYKYGTWSSRLGVGHVKKKHPVRKTEMWPRKRGGGPLRRRWPALGCSTNEEERRRIQFNMIDLNGTQALFIFNQLYYQHE